MSVSNDLDDTASLKRDLDPSPAPPAALLHDTNRFRKAARETHSTHLDGRVHPYAQGIVRFYRARTILDIGRGASGADLAWCYLKTLSPHDLPASTRWHFIELVYFRQHIANGSDSAAAEFRKRVLDIVELIDAFVDLMNSRFDRASDRT